MRAAIYTRISRDKSGEALGVERQRGDCLELAERLNWTVSGEYSDNDISAYSGKARPDYERMLRDIEAGAVDAVIAWHTDRLHRRPVELERFIDVCEAHSVDVRTVRSGGLDLSTASGRMVARMLGAAARHEVEHMVERQKSAKKQAALDGRFRGGRRSFGFASDGITHEPREAAAVAAAYRDILTGKSLRAIAREWNAEGFTTTYAGKQWDSRAVKQVITRLRNAGLIVVDGQRVPAGWPPIVDVDTFDAVEAVVTDPSRRSQFSYDRKYMGSGIYLCGKCGATMTPSLSKGSRNYKCSASAHLSRRQEDVDDLVTRVIIGRMSAPDAALTRPVPSVDVEGLRSRRSVIGVKLEEVAGLFAEGVVTADQLRVASDQLRAELATVEAEIADAQEVSALANLTLGEDGLRESWAAVSPDIQGKIIRELMTVTILPTTRGRHPGGGYFDPASVRIDWKQ